MQLVELFLQQKLRTLTLRFADGQNFVLPCEYLRVYSPSAERRALGDAFPPRKRNVNIIGIDPVGQYAVKLIFDDGHASGIYSWETLYALGVHYEHNWQQYLTKIAEAR